MKIEQTRIHLFSSDFKALYDTESKKTPSINYRTEITWSFQADKQ